MISLNLINASQQNLKELKQIFFNSLSKNRQPSNEITFKTESLNQKPLIYKLLVYRQQKLIGTSPIIQQTNRPISFDDFLQLNTASEQLEKSAQIYGIKDTESLKGILNAVDNSYFGLTPYATYLQKATFYWHRIATKQIFNNGNKRTAFLTTLQYLTQNGFTLYPSTDSEFYDISLQLSRHELDFDKLYAYLLTHTLFSDFPELSYQTDNQLLKTATTTLSVGASTPSQKETLKQILTDSTVQSTLIALAKI